MKLRVLCLQLLVFLATGIAGPVRAQNPESDQGPMAPPPKFEVKRITAEPHPGPPPLPETEMLQRMAANEDVMKKEYSSYDFTQTVPSGEAA